MSTIRRRSDKRGEKVGNRAGSRYHRVVVYEDFSEKYGVYDMDGR
jgi:hypothetical protein